MIQAVALEVGGRGLRFACGTVHATLDSMRMVDLLSETLILPEIAASTREDALAELVDHLVQNAPVELSGALALRRLQARECLASTAVGKGVAIPHAKIPQISQALACFGRSRTGIEFGARDGQKTHLFLTIVAPEGNAALHLRALARAARLLMTDEFRAQVLERSDASSIWELLQEYDARLS
ncbi:MAG: PTS sugar transporter subunit IIA [Myxococcales bacterium]|nr:PTS sugar transporter subunit IIA [Myxococcales bacterium]